MFDARWEMGKLVRITVMLLGVCLFGGILPTDAAIRYDKRFYEISDEVVSPHIPWGKPLAGGPIRILVIAPRITMREVVEVAQRLDVEHEEVMTWSPSLLGSKPNMRMYDQAEGAMEKDVKAELVEKLSRPLDVIFLGPYELSQSHGIPGQVHDPRVVDRMQEAAEQINKAGLSVGTFADSAETARKWIDAGVRYVSLSVDTGIYLKGCRDMVQGVRG